jgi:ribosomal protein S18 acetylase RimI-like enzyme
MGRIGIRTLNRLTHDDLVRLMGGYVSDARYAVKVSEGRDRVRFTVTRTRLRTPYVKEFHHLAEDTERYAEVVRLGWSLGAYEGRELVGLLLAEPRPWNRSVWVWELGVLRSHRRRGIGRRLVRGLAHRAWEEGYRTIVCETQTTNAPAIDFYRAERFRLEGVDVSYYSNEDVQRGEVAIFMKLRVPAARKARSPSNREGRSTSD